MESEENENQSTVAPPRYRDLFILSVFMLYLEILLIRWISTEIRLFAYFKNLTLIACFLGMGVGCLLSKRRLPGIVSTYPLVTGFCACVVLPQYFNHDIYTHITKYLGDFNEMALWSLGGGVKEVDALPMFGALALLLALFAFIACIFVPTGRMLGDLMDRSPQKIRAYSVNIAGSLAGIWCFSIVSFLSLPPVAWFATAFVIGLLLLKGKELLVGGVCTVLVTGMMMFLLPKDGATIWSPYQKLSYSPISLTDSKGQAVPGGYQLTVNETFYQRVVNLNEEYLAQHPDLFPEAKFTNHIGYNMVYRLTPKLDNVLVVGAGTGNDVAAALRNGAKHVDAVDIDPVIVEMGRRIHPEKPYSDPRVNVVVDDARSYFKKTKRRYDLIVFGALDSHTLVSSMSNIRIDNYVYTVESFREARELLTDDGVFCLVFAIERPFIGVRLHRIISKAFERPPILFYNQEVRALGGAGGGPTYLNDKSGKLPDRIRNNPLIHKMASDPRLRGAVAEFEGQDVPDSTDDWPYLYLENKMVPRLYQIVMCSLLFLTLLLVKPLMGEFRRVDPHFFLLGAAFLMVEVQGISKMALLFGTTWIVTSVVFTAILTMILLSNALAEHWRPPSIKPLYGLLFASLVLSYFFPFGSLLKYDFFARALFSGLLLSLPIFFAGLVFVYTFSDYESSDAALGSNLLGAIVGGACECLSFLIGINALGWVALLFYFCSLLWLQRSGRLSWKG